METLDSQSGDNKISDDAVDLLNNGAGWATAFAILMFISSFFVLIGAVQAFNVWPAGGMLYLLICAGYGYLGYVLLMQCNALTKFKSSRSSEDFDAFAKQYKAFWMGMIIFVIVMIVMLVLIINTAGPRYRF